LCCSLVEVSLHSFFSFLYLFFFFQQKTAYEIVM